MGTFEELQAGLCGERATPWLRHARVHLLLDRGAGPAGARRFKDLRCLGRGAEFAWPSPGVYTIPELARKIILHAQRARGLDVPKPPSELLNLVRLKALAPASAPVDLLAQLRHFRKLRPLGATLAEWREVLARVEDGGTPELSEWSQRTLLWLQMRNMVHADGRWESQWDAIELAIDLLEDAAFTAPWEVITERKPGHAEQVDFAVAFFKEAYPLEDRFLRALAKHREVHRLAPEAKGSTPAAWPVLSADAFAGLGPESAIFWGYADAAPSVAEVCEWLPGQQALDVPFDERKGVPPLLRALYLWSDFEAQGRPPNHSWLRSPEPEVQLAARGFRTKEAPKAEEVLAFIQEEAGERALGLEELEGVSVSDLPSWILALGDLGLLRDERRGPPHTRVSADGLPFFSLEDLPLSGAQTQVLWSVPAALGPLLEPHSEETLSKRPLPPRLQAALEGVGLAIPDPVREASLMANALAACAPRLRWLDPQAPQRGVEEEVPDWRGTRLKGEPFSPSALQSHLECPLRHYLSRERRLKRAAAWDAENFDARAKGNWIHATLEAFLGEPDWKQPEARLRALLEAGLDKAFEDTPCSPSYRRLLAAQGRVLAKQLARHMDAFERPLFELCPGRELLLEKTHAASFAGTRLEGRVDRVDVLVGGQALLWDYKSGRTSDKALNQVKKGKIQWFLYRRILRERGLEVIGGGYINPLAPDKSRLFAFENEASLRLAELFGASPHPYEVLSEDSLSEIDAVLEDQIRFAREGIEAGDISPRPIDAAACTRCEHRGLCGWPHLELP